MSIAKEERDQWRERLSSPYTCFNAAHADFSIRLLDAVEEAEEDRRRLEREMEWVIKKHIVAEWNGKFVGAVEADRMGLILYKTQSEAVASWRDAARKAVEEACPKN